MSPFSLFFLHNTNNELKHTGTSLVNICRSNERGKYRKFGCNSTD
ncbi:hypothetical protein F383_28854 [Gossypium arboreum]|uniref:Uncharacterized protein n=1 Tax=Gossypium arboreum TaxID=29729 RepID=A0A0B0PD77_GOSAR|nr:hypothetical protein F383_28854 [Gossypium arboreum]